MIGNTTGLGAFQDLQQQISEGQSAIQALQRQISEVSEGRVALEEWAEALQERVEVLEEKAEALEESAQELVEFKAKIRIPELLRHLHCDKKIDDPKRNEIVHGADLKFDLALMRSLKEVGSKIVGGYKIYYDDINYVFKQVYGYKFDEIPETVAEEMVVVFEMRSNLMHLHYWEHPTDIRKSRRAHLKTRCEKVIQKWLSGSAYSKHETEEEWKSMSEVYWGHDESF